MSTAVAPAFWVRIRQNWPRFAVSFVIGVAILFVSSGVSLLYIDAAWATLICFGVVILACSTFTFIQAIVAESGKRRVFRLLASFGSGLFGAFLVYFPLILVAEARPALGVGLLLVAAGLVRVTIGFQQRRHAGWGWTASAGLITGLTGAVVLAYWPAMNLPIMGVIALFDLLLQAVAFVMFGIAEADANPCDHSGREGTNSPAAP